MQFTRDSINILICICVICGLTIAAYYPGLSGSFQFDDIHNILRNAAVQPENSSVNNLLIAFNGNSSGPLGRKLPSLSFAINFLMADNQFDPYVFKLTNLIIHTVNAIAIFWITSLLLSSSTLRNQEYNRKFFISASIATAWAIHPLQLTTVLYVVQRMVSMAAFFVFVGLILYLYGRRKLIAEKSSGWLLMATGYIIAIVIGGICKETAVLFPALIVALEISLLDWSEFNDKKAKQLKTILALTIALPSVIALIFLITHPHFIFDSYQYRDFDLQQRVLTQTRVLWLYISLIIIPRTGEMGLYHDDFLTSTSLFAPMTTFPAVISLILIFCWLLSQRKKSPLLFFVMAWFAASHALESTVYALEMIHEHRNYIGLYGFVLIGGIQIEKIMQRNERPQAIKLLVVAILTVLALATFSRATTWSDPTVFSHFEVRNHPASSRAQLVAAVESQLLPNSLPETYEHLRLAALNNGGIRPIIEMYKRIYWLNRHLDAPILKKIIDNSSPVENNSQKLNWASPLPNSIELLSKLETEITDEINRLTQIKTPTAELTNTLRDVISCLSISPADCSVDKNLVLNWTLATLKMTADNNRLRPTLGLVSAKILASTGDTEGALNELQRTIELSPESGYLLIEKAALYNALGWNEQALKILDSILQSSRFNNFERRMAKQKIVEFGISND